MLQRHSAAARSARAKLVEDDHHKQVLLQVAIENTRKFNWASAVTRHNVSEWR
jgi:hypothetical protein